MRTAADVDISDWTPELQEARGSGANEWLRDGGGRQWLFKATREARDTGEPQGEDWAEKVVERLAPLLGVPCARVELAHRVVAGRVHRGVICLDLAGPGVSLLNGHNLLVDVPGYRYRDSGGVRPPKNHVGHTVATVAAQLRLHEVQPPDVTELAGMSAFDAFVGFLVLDAWVGNADRHEDNWAVLREAAGVMSLAPSYDHGAALGSTLTEARRAGLAADAPGLERFAAGGYGKKFADGAKVPLTTFAADALAMASSSARHHWLDNLAAISVDGIRDAVDGVPRMSDLLVRSANNCWASTGGGCSMTVADVTARERGLVGATRRLLVTEKDSENFYRPVGFLSARESDAGPTYTFDYLRSAVQRAGFRPFLGFSDVHRSYRSDGLFPLFAERIMDPRRPDHPMFLSALDLSGDVAPLEVLARSGGQRVGDGIFLLPVPEVAVDGRTQCVFLVHGMRYIDGAQERAADLTAGDTLQLVPDPDNPATSRAVLVAHDNGGRLGYVPDALLGYVESVDDRRLDVVRVNGPEVGVRLRLLVRLAGRADPAAQPFTGADWATVAND